MGVGESIERDIHKKQQCWTDKKTILSLMPLNLACGDCVDDLEKLEGDDVFCKVLRRIDQKGMKRRERRELDRLAEGAGSGGIVPESSISVFISFS